MLLIFTFREEKTELLTEYKEELEHANGLVSKLKAEVTIKYLICKLLTLKCLVYTEQ